MSRIRSAKTQGTRVRLALSISTLGTGGAERVLTILANAWAAQDHEVTLITFDAASAVPIFPLLPKVRLVQLGLMAKSKDLQQAIKSNISRIAALRRTLQLIQPDVVVSFIDTMNVTTLSAAWGTGIPVVVSERIDPHHHEIGTVWSNLRRITYPWADTVVVQSQRAAAYFAGTDVETRIIQNPVALPENETSSTRADGRPQLLTLGRLHPQKQQELLVVAFAKIATLHPEWTLTIHGEGPERPRLECLIATLGMTDRVLLPGMTTEPLSRLAGADLFALTSAYEGFPNALVEAMAVGLPVVSFDCPSGPAELITHGENGLLVPPGDVEALAAALDRLMSDPAERERLGARAREVRERLALPRILAMWDEVLEGAIARRRRR
jgi:glycosyltransferase involved in cell wall biosynthesis